MNQGFAQDSLVIPMVEALLTKGRDEIDGAMHSKPILSRFIVLLRPSLGVPRRFAGLQLTSSDRGYPCSRRSLIEYMDKMWPDPVFCTRCYESVSTDSSSSGFPASSSLPSRSAAATNSAGVRYPNALCGRWWL